MRVKLPRECSGQEIIDAFKYATTVSAGSEKWEPQEFIGELMYEPGSVKRVIKSIGVCAEHFFLWKRGIFFGKKTWEMDDTKLTLDPVASSTYQEVNICVDFSYVDYSGHRRFSRDPGKPEFEAIRPEFEAILAKFYERLQPKTTQA